MQATEVIMKAISRVTNELKVPIIVAKFAWLEFNGESAYNHKNKYLNQNPKTTDGAPIIIHFRSEAWF